MPINSEYVIHAVNGRLSDGGSGADTSRAMIAQMVAKALAAEDPELILHFHGGLVDKIAGLGIATRLYEKYSGGSRTPLFFVWEAGLLESIQNNLKDIGDDRLFRGLVKKVSRWVLERMPAASGLKGAGGPDPAELERQYDEWFEGQRDTIPDALQAKQNETIVLKSAHQAVDEVDLARRVRRDLDNDELFKLYLQELHADLDPAKISHPIPKVSGVGAVVTVKSDVAPEQVHDVMDVSEDTKGIFTLAKTAAFIVKVTIAVIRRLREGRGHGLYTTIVEEILGAAYIDKVGGVIWRQMKKDTGDAFGDPDETAGSALLKEIGEQQKATGKAFKRIVLIGHSTGAVYIANLIDASEKLLPDAKFDVILLAPAITYEKLAGTLEKHAARIQRVRRFAMRDSVESKDALVPIIYPRSLLYFVSGVVEFSEDDDPTRRADTPLVGMERYRLDPDTFDATKYPEVHAVEKLLGAGSNSVWSITGDTDSEGLRSKSQKHGDFDNDDDTVASVVRILRKGF